MVGEPRETSVGLKGDKLDEQVEKQHPDALTGTDAAAIWYQILGHQVAHCSDDPSGFEQNLATFMLRLAASEMRLNGRALGQRRHAPVGW